MPGSVTRRRVLIGVAVAVALILLLSLRGIARMYTDYLWFDSLGQSSVWSGLLGARLVLSLVFVLLFFGIGWVNLYVADRLAPAFRPAGPEDELLERYHEVVAGRMHWVRAGVAGFLALIAGLGAGGEWSSWLLFTNGGSFGIDDPQFGQDVGFYVFKLPFLNFVVDWLFASVLIILIITAVAHYLNGGIRVQTTAPRVSPQVKAHLSVLLAALALIRAVDYYLQRFELASSSGGVVDGATYQDVNARIPALNLLVLISLAGAILFIVNIFRRGWTLPAVAVAVWAFVSVVAGGIYPAYVQRFQVGPNESAREAPYIERNMEATRFALGIDEIRRERFTPNTRDAEAVELAGYEPTLRNVRLWDPSDRISLQSFDQLQSIRNYYDISDIDVDRYMIDDEVTTAGLGLRTIDESNVPIGSWEGRHLAYTHGYGAVLAPLGATDQREPDFLIQDIPERITGEGLSLAQPRTYFGEAQSGYVMVGTGRDEIDYEDEDAGGEVSTPYEGSDGVGAGSLFRRLAFALRFGDFNPIISGFMDSDTKVLYNRDIADRISELAPFLHADTDPYPVLLDDKTVWVQDLYTTTDRFPYGQRANTDELTSDSGLRHRFNYVRNSVKATVDAYDGTVTFYVMDDEDPIIDAWRNAFPSLFTDASEMPAELEAHLRYPEDLFRVQTAAWQRYHLQDVGAFYNQTNAWTVARDPGTVSGDETTQVTNASGEVTDVRAARIPPYYQVLQLPGEDTAEFTLTRSFVPFSPEDERQQLTGFMAARMDPGQYGELVVYEMPTGDLPQGPGIAAANINSNPIVSAWQTLFAEGNSSALFGNQIMLPVGDFVDFVDGENYLVDEFGDRLVDQDGNQFRVEISDGSGALVTEGGDPAVIEEGTLLDSDGNALPGEDGEPLVTGLEVDEDGVPQLDEDGNVLRGGLAGSLIYVQPLYVEPEDPRRPRLGKVIVAFGEEVVIENTLQEALEALFGEQVETAEDTDIDDELAELDPSDNIGLPDEIDLGDGADTGAEDEPDVGDGEEPDEPAEGADANPETRLAQEALDLFTEAEDALAEGDLGTYQEKVNEGRGKLEELEDLLSGEDEAA